MEKLYVRVPGRTEIAGNHTDHEGGHVIAAALDRYAEAVVEPSSDRMIRVVSPKHADIAIAIDESFEPQQSELEHSPSLVRGLAAGFVELGYAPKPFSAQLNNAILTGSGLSSSAAFELVIASIMNTLWADGALSPEELAQLSQKAERDWYGKPCGLMDQAACALGGIQHMSFEEGQVHATRLDFDFADYDYEICLVAVGEGHEDLTSEYAAIPQEMQAVARLLGKTVLSELYEDDLIAKLSSIRSELGDRAVLRALHFYREEKLVKKRAEALRNNDLASFLELTRMSGASSAMYLQNVSVYGKEQAAMVALALAEELLAGKGAARIHGGGFGGTVQVFVPSECAQAFLSSMNTVFGEGAAQLYNVVTKGAEVRWM